MMWSNIIKYGIKIFKNGQKWPIFDLYLTKNRSKWPRFGKQINIPNTNNNHHGKGLCDQTWPSVVPKSSKWWKMIYILQRLTNISLNIGHSELFYFGMVCIFPIPIIITMGKHHVTKQDQTCCQNLKKWPIFLPISP